MQAHLSHSLEAIYQEFKKYIDENIPINKLVAITTDGAPAMRGVRAGFIALCRNDPKFAAFIDYQCYPSTGLGWESLELFPCHDTGGQTDKLD